MNVQAYVVYYFQMAYVAYSMLKTFIKLYCLLYSIGSFEIIIVMSSVLYEIEIP